MSEIAKIYDILLKNGHVIDPKNNIDGKMDLAINDKKVALIEKDINPALAKKVIDVKGNYIFPGIIDIHTHIYPLLPRDSHCLAAVDADAHLLKEGITATADAGTVGWRDFLYFKRDVIDKSTVKVVAFLNIGSGGMVDMRTEQNFREMHPEIVAEVAKQYKGTIVGVKAAHYHGGPQPFDDEHPPWASVENAVKAASLCDMPAMIDFQPNLPLCPYADLINIKMRPGDIHTHCFAQQFPIVNDETKKVYDHMRKARERGVYFDVGHGGGSFWFRNGLVAYEDGFPPDTISTDLHMGNIHGAVLSMLHVMGKFHNMGMPLNEVVMRSTCMPAKLINRPDLGSLSIGNAADVAVIRKLEGDYDYIDNGRARIKGNSKFECLMTLVDGEIVHDAYGLSMPLWTEMGHDYWNPRYRG